MRKLFLLFLLFSTLAHGQSRFFLKGKTVSVTTGSEVIFSNVSTIQSGSTITVSFDVDRVEEPAKPIIERVTVSGTETDGQTLTASYSGFYSASGYSDASTWQWYRADNSQSVGTVVGGATSATYVLSQTDVSKVLRPVLTPIDGVGTVGDPVTGVYTGTIQDDEFNPITDLPSFTALQLDGAVDLATNLYWRNDGTGLNSTQSGSDAIPVYSVANGGGVDFESTNNEELILDQPSPQFSLPITVVIRLRFESFNAGFSYPLAWTSSQRFEQRASGAIYLSGGNCAYTASTNKWTIFYMVISGSANTSQFQVNWGTNKTDVAASTSAFGTSNGRIGSNSGGTGNRFDGMISDVYVIPGVLSAPDKALLQGWFETNAPHDP